MIDFFIEKLDSIRKWAGKSASLLAIDIQPDLIRLIEMSRRGGDFIVESYATEMLPTESVEPLTATMARLLKRSGSRCRRLVIALAESGVMVRKLNLRPDQSLEDIQDEIELIFDQLIPFPLEESDYDYLIQDAGNISKEGPESFSSDRIWKKSEKPAQEILLAASLRKTVSERVDGYRAMGFKAVMVTPDSLSILRALYFILENLENGPELMASQANIALLDLRSAKTTFFFFQNNRMILTQTLLSVLEALNPENQQILCEELERILKQFHTEAGNVSIKYFILAGESTWVHRLKPELENRFNIKMIIANVVANMVFSRTMPIADQQKLRAEASLLLSNFGLLLCGLETEQGIEHKRKINLLPWRTEKRKRENKQFFCLLAFLGVLMIIAMMGVNIYFYLQTMQIDANCLPTAERSPNIKRSNIPTRIPPF